MSGLDLASAEQAVRKLLSEDKVCAGAVGNAAVRQIGWLIVNAASAAGDTPQTPEIDDVLAWLEQRRDNARTVAANNDGCREWAHDRACQLDVIIGDLRAGMHRGAALVRAQLLAAKFPDDGED